MHKNVVLIPTYNEAATISDLINDLRFISIDVYVIDDNSPDGTANIVTNLNRPNVRLIENGIKKGIGPAYLAGFSTAINEGYELIATMDADGSHSVTDLQTMLEACRNSDVVMGTRWMTGGIVSNWSLHRRFLSKFGTKYARVCLGLPYKDLTGGLRVYKGHTLGQLNLGKIRSNGYCFQIEMIRAFASMRSTIKEVPIHFVEREKGTSKMSRSIVLEAFVKVSIWGLERMFRRNTDKLHYVK